MTPSHQDISRRGRTIRVPAATIGAHRVIVTGRSVRMAALHDADFVDAVVTDPDSFVRQLKQAGIRADILTFPQRIDEHDPKYAYRFDWDNAAVAPTADYDAWWEQLPQVARKNVRRAAKRGVTVEVASFDDAFVKGIKGIYDESPIRQGRRFWHFGKDVDTIKAENGSYLDRAEFIGAYHDGQLIGFMKFVYVGRLAVIMQIVAKAAHNDKRPMNALIAKAVEVCHEKGIAYLVYSKFTYGKKTNSEIAEFKARNGFVQMNYPRYFVPLTIRGRVALALNLHRPWVALLPSGLMQVLLTTRARLLNVTSRIRSAPGQLPANGLASTGSADVD